MTFTRYSPTAAVSFSNHFSIRSRHNKQSSMVSVKPETRNQSLALLIDIIGGQVFINSQTRASDRKGSLVNWIQLSECKYRNLNPGAALRAVLAPTSDNRSALSLATSKLQCMSPKQHAFCASMLHDAWGMRNYTTVPPSSSSLSSRAFAGHYSRSCILLS